MNIYIIRTKKLYSDRDFHIFYHRETRWNSRVSCGCGECNLQVAGCRLQVAGCRLQVAGCMSNNNNNNNDTCNNNCWNHKKLERM